MKKRRHPGFVILPGEEDLVYFLLARFPQYGFATIFGWLKEMR